MTKLMYYSSSDMLPARSVSEQSLPAEPIVNEAGDLRIVAVHHHHVGIAANTDLRQIDHVGTASGVAHGGGEIHAELPHARPARAACDEIAIQHQDRDVLE